MGNHIQFVVHPLFFLNLALLAHVRISERIRYIILIEYTASFVITDHTYLGVDILACNVCYKYWNCVRLEGKVYPYISLFYPIYGVALKSKSNLSQSQNQSRKYLFTIEHIE